MLSVLATLASADVYMHHPRGSNNRYDTENANDPEVENNARLFDSQNNNDGGYDIGRSEGAIKSSFPLRYYTGSALTIQWASQHACGKDSWINCQFVLQYMCDYSCNSNDPQGCNVRDGASNEQVTYDNEDPASTENIQYGLHESWYNYNSCDRRERNRGLYIADREDNINGNDARYTRQNNNANRRGLECPEERDYYPYWAPSEWRDLAILVDDTDRCQYYYDNTQNTNSKFQCVDTRANSPVDGKNQVQFPISESDCTSRQSEENGNQFTWEEVTPWFRNGADIANDADSPFPHEPFWNAGVRSERRECVEMRAKQANGEVDMTAEEVEEWCTGILNAPDCVENTFQRDNHLGVVMGGYLANYTWWLPDAPAKSCVVRLRYNMSSDDYDPWTTFSSQNSGEDDDEGPVSQDPYVIWSLSSQPLSLALNTNQYGRTFQDRSHTFAVIPRSEPACWKDADLSVPCDAPDAAMADATIWNVGVTGKRGTITQVYPSTRLDFTPQDLHIKAGDYVHFQWEGESQGVENYWGGGKPRTARTNLVQIESRKHNIPMEAPDFPFPTSAVRESFAMAGQEKNPSSCASLESLLDDYNYQDNDNENERMDKLKKIREDNQNCMWLNQAPSRFYSMPIQFPRADKEFHYMSTRNTWPGFASQKGSVYVHPRE